MKNNKGSILAIVIIFVFIFTLLGMFAMRLVILQNETSDSELYYTRAHFAAIYGSELALWRIMQWENIASSSTNLNPLGRKFLAEHNSCFSYQDNKWYPLNGVSNTDIDAHFSDSITGNSASGIRLYCYVEEEAVADLNPNDGFIPNMAANSITGQFGTYKFYVIKTSATMYSDYQNSLGEIAAAKDELHFFIAYSTGPRGARPISTISLDIRGPKIDPFSALGSTYTAAANSNPFVQSAPKRSIITGQVQPIFRYYIRGRR